LLQNGHIYFSTAAGQIKEAARKFCEKCEKVGQRAINDRPYNMECNLAP